jgi:hypothetical protein
MNLRFFFRITGRARELLSISTQEFILWMGSFLFTLFIGATYGIAASLGLGVGGFQGLKTSYVPLV